MGLPLQGPAAERQDCCRVSNGARGRGGPRATAPAQRRAHRLHPLPPLARRTLVQRLERTDTYRSTNYSDPLKLHVARTLATWTPAAAATPAARAAGGAGIEAAVGPCMRRSRSAYDTPQLPISCQKLLGTACAAGGLARAPSMALAALRRALQRGAGSEAVLAACDSRAAAAGRPSAGAFSGARWLSGVPVHEVRSRLGRSGLLLV